MGGGEGRDTGGRPVPAGTRGGAPRGPKNHLACGRRRRRRRRGAARRWLTHGFSNGVGYHPRTKSSFSVQPVPHQRLIFRNHFKDLGWGVTPWLVAFFPRCPVVCRWPAPESDDRLPRRSPPTAALPSLPASGAMAPGRNPALPPVLPLRRGAPSTVGGAGIAFGWSESTSHKKVVRGSRLTEDVR